MLNYSELNNNMVSILAGIHTLAHIKKKLTGDSIDVLFFDKNS
jgi:hypothetical protein